MTIRAYLVSALVFFVGANALASDNKSKYVISQKYETKITCPAQDFSKFLYIFSENIHVQMVFTKYPLQWSEVDAAAEPEPRVISRQLSRDQVQFPVIIKQAERKKRSLELKVNFKNQDRVELILFKDDTDYLVKYYFIKKSCWYLERIEDSSL